MGRWWMSGINGDDTYEGIQEIGIIVEARGSTLAGEAFLAQKIHTMGKVELTWMIPRKRKKEGIQ